jgi:hypothetical protein
MDRDSGIKKVEDSLFSFTESMPSRHYSAQKARPVLCFWYMKCGALSLLLAPLRLTDRRSQPEMKGPARDS